MGQRLQLQTLLEEILGTNEQPGSSRVYFQPPASVVMEYPCIVYKRDSMDVDFADDRPYNKTKRYQVTVIDRDPDSVIPDKIADLPMCSFSAHFVADNLNHDVYSLYF